MNKNTIFDCLWLILDVYGDYPLTWLVEMPKSMVIFIQIIKSQWDKKSKIKHDFCMLTNHLFY